MTMNNKHIYYRLILTLESPVSIGSGDDVYTDSDVIKDSRGDTFIPASSLCGVYRSIFSESDKNKYFGQINGGESVISPIKVYDGILLGDSSVSVRDSVALNEFKAARDGAKFDFEIIETGAKFRTFIEVDKNNCSDDVECQIVRIISALNDGTITLGKKTTRGYGKVSVVYQKLEFLFPADLDKWLDFDMFDDSQWKTISKQTPSKSEKDLFVIELELRQVGGISIRRYSTGGKGNGESSPDYEQLTLKDNTPVIPGTSWAGAFRHRCGELVRELQIQDGENLIENMFGYVNDNTARKSRIIFSESRIKGGESKIITRNSIDRFSAGTKDGALYTEKTYYNGECGLEIRMLKNDLYYQLILTCVKDLHNGLLAVGGLTAVGRGMFKVKKMVLDGEEVLI